MPRFKAYIKDGRRKLADLEVEVRGGVLRGGGAAAAASLAAKECTTHACADLRSCAQVSQVGLKLEEARTKKLLGCGAARAGTRACAAPVRWRTRAAASRKRAAGRCWPRVPSRVALSPRRCA
jgi:hypothetical protein